MNLLALLPLVPLILGLAWAIWLLFKKDILAQGPVQVVTYFIGVVLALWVIGWLVDAFLPQWVAQRLQVAQQSEDIQTIEQISREILMETAGTTPPTPTVVLAPTPTPAPAPAPTVSPLPSPPTPSDAGVSPAMDMQGGERVHTVASGENLYRISRQYGVSMQAIQERNNLSDPNHIYVGQQLIIPSP